MEADSRFALFAWDLDDDDQIRPAPYGGADDFCNAYDTLEAAKADAGNWRFRYYQIAEIYPSGAMIKRLVGQVCQYEAESGRIRHTIQWTRK